MKMTSENVKKGARVRATRGGGTGVLYAYGIRRVAGGGLGRTLAILVLRDGEDHPLWHSPEDWEIMI